MQVGRFNITDGNYLEEQIAINKRRSKILNAIARPKAQARKEKQPKKKFELVQKIQALREELI